MNKKEVGTLLALVLIFILAFGVRAHLMQYDYIFGFDSYFHTRMLGYYVEGSLPDSDPLAYYYRGGLPGYKLMPGLFWVSGLFHSVFLGAPTQESLLFTAKLLPALFGAFIALAMYFFMREFTNQKSALLAALFVAFVPSFVYRTMSGFFEEDALGFLWMLLGFLFLVRSIKVDTVNQKSLLLAFTSGLFLGLMAVTWKLFLLIPIVLGMYFVLFLAYSYYVNRNSFVEKFKPFAINFAVAFAIFLLITTWYWGFAWIKSFFAYLPFDISTGASVSVAGDAPNPALLTETIGEENPGYLYFGEKYNALLIFPLVALLVIPWRAWKKKAGSFDFLVFSWIAITLFMALLKLKFTYVFGLPVAVSAGFLFYVLKPEKKQLVSFAFLFLILTGVAAATHFVETKRPFISPGDNLDQAFSWIKANTPEDARFFNWWDYGHLMSFFTERKILIDNRNTDLAADISSARLLITSSEDEAKAIIDEYGGAEYLIVTLDTMRKISPIALYAFNTVDRNDSRLAGYSFSATRCAFDAQNEAYVCLGFQQAIPKETMEVLPTTWTEKPLTYTNGRNPLFMYRSPDNSRVFLLRPNQVEPNAGQITNNSMGNRLFFEDASLEHFELVYSNNEVKIYKVLN